MIKNNTYYNGKLYLKIEKDPYYVGQSRLNKVHFDFKFFTIATRISTKEYNEELLRLIAQDQGCALKSYDIDSKGDIQYYDFNQKRVPCFVKNDIWLDIDSVFMYYKNNMIVIDHGLAAVYNKDDLVVGYYGHSHRGGCTVKIGDKVFDEKYKIYVDDLDYSMYNKKLIKSKYGEYIEDFIPFNKRGHVVVNDFSQAKQSAKNISKYLS